MNKYISKILSYIIVITVLMSFINTEAACATSKVNFNTNEFNTIFTNKISPYLFNKMDNIPSLTQQIQTQKNDQKETEEKAEVSNTTSTENVIVTNDASQSSDTSTTTTTAASTTSDTTSTEEKTDTVYTVVSGDSLWKISEEFYGNGIYCKYIAYANNIDVNAIIHVGQKLTIPAKLDSSYTYTSTDDAASSSSTTSSSTSSSSDYSNSSMTYIGQYYITGYEAFSPALGGDGITASGKVATIGYTVAMQHMAFGTILYIEGYGYYCVQDRGCANGVIDIACGSYNDCISVTNVSGNVKVYVVN